MTNEATDHHTTRSAATNQGIKKTTMLWGWSLSVWQGIFFWATATAAVAGALSITSAFVSAIVGYQITDFVQRQADEKIADAGKEAGRANERTATLEKEAASLSVDVANANARAAEANEKAEGERLARLQIEARLAPRTISDAQKAVIIGALKPFAGTSVDILIYGGGSDDALPLAGMIGDAFTGAGWTPRIWNTISPGRWVKGVLVSVQDDIAADAGENTAATAVIAALGGAQIAVGRYDVFAKGGTLPDNLNGPPWDATKVAPIRILVGSKPQ